MSKIIGVCAWENYKLIIDFDDGSTIIFNMQKMIKIIPYFRLKDLASFQSVKYDEKSVYWDAVDGKKEYLPLTLSIDTILFSLRG